MRARIRNVGGVALGCAVVMGAVAQARPVWAAPTLTVQRPTAGTVVGPEASWSLLVQSSYASFPSFRIRFGGVLVTETANLQRQPGTWAGSFPTAAVPEGPQTLELELTDGANETSSVSVDVVNNRAPVAALLAPAVDPARKTLVPSNVRVHATCTDAGLFGCAAVELWMRRGTGLRTLLVAGGPDVLDRRVELPPGEVSLCVVARDTRGVEASTAEVVVYAAGGPNFAVVDEVSGTVLDADPTRTLYTDGASVFVRTRATGQTTRLGPGAALWGRLAPLGAIWSALGEPRGYVSWNGTLRSDVGVNAAASGGYAAWFDTTTQAVVREDLVTAQRITVVQGGFVLGAGNPHVAVNAAGDVAWNQRQGISSFVGNVWRNGQVTTFGLGFETMALGDDFLLGAQRHGHVYRAPFAGGAIQTLASFTAPPISVPTILAAGSWGSFMDSPRSKTLSAVNANGALEQVSAYATGSYPLGVSPSGDVAYHHASAGPGAVYVGRSSGGVPQPPYLAGVGASGVDRLRPFAWFDGAFHWLYGGSVVRLGENLGGFPDVPGGGGDAGAGDAGGGDAGAGVPELPDGGEDPALASDAGAYDAGRPPTGSAAPDDANARGNGGAQGGNGRGADGGCAQANGGSPGGAGLVIGLVLGLCAAARARRRSSRPPRVSSGSA